jgi:molybdopterin/thiamine biosynthesis adenylyltransferase
LFFRLILAKGLGTVSVKAGTRGYFGGWVVKSERLAVAVSSQLTGGEPLYGDGTVRLFQHWYWPYGTSTKELVLWVAVKRGFSNALKVERISRNNLADWVADEQPLGLPDEPVTNLCCIELDANDETIVTLLFLFDNKIGVGQVQTIASEPELSPRLDGLKPAKELQLKRAAIIGVGSGGSMVAVNLAAAGVGSLHLFDKDFLSAENVFRHACDLRHVGRPKVLAVKDQIASHNLPAKVVTHEQDVVEDASELWAVMTEVDLVLCATDSILSRRLVNYIAVRSGLPLIMACTFENASIGEIINVKPGESACYECTRLQLSKLGVLQRLTDGDESSGLVPYGSEVEHGVGPAAANQGSRADVTIVAALQSRVAISALLRKEAPEKSLPADYLTWGGRTITSLSDPFNFERPFGTNWVHLERQDECPVCGEIGRPIDKESNRTYEEIIASLGSTTA